MQQGIIFEQWKPVFGLEGHYEVSSLGRLRSLRCKGIERVKYMSLRQNSEGYFNVRLKGENRKVHKLVAAAFLGNTPAGMVVNHKDGDKTNNRVDNLEYVSRRDNVTHGKRSMKNKHKACNFVGVDKNKKNGRFRARIFINGRSMHIGIFRNEADAGLAYQAALLACKEPSKYALATHISVSNSQVQLSFTA